jgi:hypothetical protein
MQDLTPGTARRAPRIRWTWLLAVGLGVGLVALGLVGRGLLRGGGHEPAESIDTDKYLWPIETAADPRTGEEIAPFSGFAISVETEPPDALVTIAGVERGESPVLAGIACKPGAKVPIRVEMPGFRAVRTATTCRTDALVKLTVRLAP